MNDHQSTTAPNAKLYPATCGTAPAPLAYGGRTSLTLQQYRTAPLLITLLAYPHGMHASVPETRALHHHQSCSSLLALNARLRCTRVHCPP